ncbi:hypothetical protein PWT90_00616 [Aphanocladium album]|nr:hypothetical protein PWT90_00616 [Aphanocladium album]
MASRSRHRIQFSTANGLASRQAQPAVQRTGAAAQTTNVPFNSLLQTPVSQKRKPSREEEPAEKRASKKAAVDLDPEARQRDTGSSESFPSELGARDSEFVVEAISTKVRKQFYRFQQDALDYLQECQAQLRAELQTEMYSEIETRVRAEVEARHLQQVYELNAQHAQELRSLEKKVDTLQRVRDGVDERNPELQKLQDSVELIWSDLTIAKSAIHQGQADIAALKANEKKAESGRKAAQSELASTKADFKSLREDIKTLDEKQNSAIERHRKIAAASQRRLGEDSKKVLEQAEACLAQAQKAVEECSIEKIEERLRRAQHRILLRQANTLLQSSERHTGL